jgi:hypothetical protein
MDEPDLPPPPALEEQEDEKEPQPVPAADLPPAGSEKH